jgi:hypothetical protein
MRLGCWVGSSASQNNRCRTFSGAPGVFSDGFPDQNSENSRPDTSLTYIGKSTVIFRHAD